MPSIQKIITKAYFFPLLLLLLVIPSFISIIRPGFFPMHDDLQAFRIFEMDKCFQDFQIPCRWVPDAGYQYGYPQFEYYPPSVYYIGELFHLVGFQFIDSVKVLIVLGFVLSALFMYLFLKDWLGIWPAVVGALLYTYAPYKALDIYVRGAISEFWALVIFPLIFWAIFKLIKTQKVKYLGFFAVSTGLLLITHNLMTFIFLPVVTVWAGSLIVIEKKWKMTVWLILGGLLGLGLAAFFTLPVLLERDFVHIESLVGGYFDYRQHFVNLEQLFWSNHYGYGSSMLGSDDDLTLSTGQIHFLVALIGLFLALVNFKKDRKIFILTVSLFILAILSIFMTHQKSTFIWEKWGFFEYIQFPWRFLGNSIFLLSIMGAVAVYFVKNSKLAIGLGVVAIFSVLVLDLNFFAPRSWFNISDHDKFSGNLWEKQLTISIFDYLPIYAKLPPTSKAPEKPEVLEGVVSFSEYKKGSNFQIGKADVKQSALIRLPLFDFPGMEVLVDGKKVNHWHNDCRYQNFCLGLITFNLSEGKHEIKASLKNTPIRWIGNISTLISILIIFLIFTKFGKGEKRFV